MQELSLSGKQNKRLKFSDYKPRNLVDIAVNYGKTEGWNKGLTEPNVTIVYI